MNIFIQHLFENQEYFVVYVIFIIFSICVHEFSHALIALSQGDDTAASLGHLTLNPMRQMGVMSIVLLLFIGVAWGAVPVNTQKMRHRFSPALVAFAGPFSNLLLATIFSGITVLILVLAPDATKLIKYLTLASVLNMLLFILNMLPVYPFDGWQILSNFFPLHRLKGEWVNAFALAMIIAVFSLFHYLYITALYCTGILFDAIDFLIRIFSL